MNILQIAAQFALIATLGAVIWYTVETHLLRRLQVRPSLVLTADLDNGALLIRNVGTSAALNVEIPDFQGGLSQMISAGPNWLDFLQVGDKRTIDLRFPPGSPGMALEAIFAEGLLILLRYQDIDGQSYETQTQVTSKRTEILHTRRIRFWSR